MIRPKPVTITLTDAQHEAMQPLYDALNEYAATNAVGYAVLMIAQPHSPRERVADAGKMPVRFLFAEEARAVQAVISLIKFNGEAGDA